MVWHGGKKKKTGTHRYFVVQTALMRTPPMFPPSRRSVVFSTFGVGKFGEGWDISVRASIEVD